MSEHTPNPLAPRHRELDADEVQSAALAAVRSDIEGALDNLLSALQDYDIVYQQHSADTYGDEIYGSLTEYAREIKKIVARYPQKQERAAA